MWHVIRKGVVVDMEMGDWKNTEFQKINFPIFLPVISAIEIAFFLYYLAIHEAVVPTNSSFIYRPDKRSQIWRFVFYIVLHTGWSSLFYNVLIQLIVGIPLEIVHGSLRTAAIYFAGVLAGSLGTSLFDSNACLVGASGGVYALLSAHAANILLNYSQIDLLLLRILALIIIVLSELYFTVWRSKAEEPKESSFCVAHIAGAFAGLLSGVLVLKSCERSTKGLQNVIWWTACIFLSFSTIYAVLWNITMIN